MIFSLRRWVDEKGQLGSLHVCGSYPGPSWPGKGDGAPMPEGWPDKYRVETEDGEIIWRLEGLR